ncbi:MAG: DUF4959 domain-containing protein [Muribaculaceae bacterium]|nr:DUF4959 domain-containing protein [Muribaculaceae bacterium]
MKNSIKIFLLTLLLVCVTSCSDEKKYSSIENDKDFVPSAVTNVSYEAGYGSVDITWTLPDEENLYYINVSYLDNDGKPAGQKIFVPTDETRSLPQTCRVTGFMVPEEKTFTITTVAFGGKTSEPVEIKATPLDAGAVKDNVLETTTFTAAEYGFHVNWENSAEFPTEIWVEYKADGTEKTTIVDATNTDKFFVGFFQEETDITYYCVNPYDGSQTEKRTAHVAPLTNPIDNQSTGASYITFTGDATAAPRNLQVKHVSDVLSNYRFQFETIWLSEERTGVIDPYMYSDPFAADYRGLVLIFRYMVNMDSHIQFFYVSYGGGALGGKSTPTINLKESPDEWQNFVFDCTQSATSWGWKAATGDRVRIDVDDRVEGVILDVRNMRFITVDDAKFMGLL